MERVGTSDSRVLPLTALLVRPEGEQANAPVPEAEAMPDPRQVLEQERLRVLKEARDEGYALGAKDAERVLQANKERLERQILESHKQESERLQAALEQMQALLKSLPDAVANVEGKVESAAAEVAFVALASLLGDATVRETLVLNICRKALDEYRLRPVVLRVAPKDFDSVSGLQQEESVRVVADPNMVSGGCRLETHKGTYETSLETRLEAISKALAASMLNGDEEK